jgi:hypothetical protein
LHPIPCHRSIIISDQNLIRNLKFIEPYCWKGVNPLSRVRNVFSSSCSFLFQRGIIVSANLPPRITMLPCQLRFRIRFVILISLLLLHTNSLKYKGETIRRRLGKQGYTRCSKGTSVIDCQTKSSVCDISSGVVARCLCIVGFVGEKCDIRIDNKCQKFNTCPKSGGSYCVDDNSSKGYNCQCFQGYKAVLSKDKTLRKCVKVA